MSAAGEGGDNVSHLRPRGPQEPPPLNPDLAARIVATRHRVLDVLADISVMAASFSNDVRFGQPEYAYVLKRLYRELDQVAAELEEVAPEPTGAIDET